MQEAETAFILSLSTSVFSCIMSSFATLAGVDVEMCNPAMMMMKTAYGLRNRGWQEQLVSLCTEAPTSVPSPSVASREDTTGAPLFGSVVHVPEN